VESPLTAFIFVLLRDHLPAGTVRFLIQRAQCPGDPDMHEPELEALAERLAEELRLAPGRHSDEEPEEEPTPPEAPRRGSIERQARSTYKDRALEWINRQGHREIRPSEVRDAIGCSGPTQSKIIRELAEEGSIRAIGNNQARRLFAVNPITTSEPDHDDAGEGLSPGDPAGDGEEGSPASSSREESPLEGTQQPGSDDGGGQSGALAASRGPGLHVRPGESDVELMARVGDFVNEAGVEGVFAVEIEQAFGINSVRRRTIMGMLEERRRIRKVPGQARRYVGRAATASGEPDFRMPGDQSEGGGEINLREPEPEITPDPTPEETRSVFAWAQGQRTFRRRAAQEAFPDLDPAVLGKILTGLCARHRLVTRNGDGAPFYAVVGSPDSKANGRTSTGEQRPSLEGRIMGWLQEPKTAEQAALHFGIARDEAAIVLDRLVGESLLQRTTPPSGACIYAPV
jgi:hypothetical protein